MKALTLIVFIALLLWFGGFIACFMYADYDYTNRFVGYWNLSVKASTIQQKSEYLDLFIDRLEHEDFASHDALFFKTPDNDTVQNILALKSLQLRLHEIFAMNVHSFEYQQAIQQITAQEQDDAGAILERIEGAWYLKHHFFLWGWIGICLCIFLVLAIIVAGIFGYIAWFDSYD